MLIKIIKKKAGGSNTCLLESTIYHNAVAYCAIIDLNPINMDSPHKARRVRKKDKQKPTPSIIRQNVFHSPCEPKVIPLCSIAVMRCLSDQ